MVKPTLMHRTKGCGTFTGNELANLGVIEAVYDAQDDLDEATLALAMCFEGISLSDFAGTMMRVRNPVRQ